MSTAKFIGDRPDDVKRLATEVADLKSVLEGMLQQVRRVERRIDLVLPAGAKAKRGGTVNGNGPVKSVTLNPNQARQTVDRLTETLRDKRPVQTELRSMTMKHQLQPIARELGIADSPAKTELIMRIVTRLRQRIMLTENAREVSGVAEGSGRFGN